MCVWLESSKLGVIDQNVNASVPEPVIMIAGKVCAFKPISA